MVFPRFLPLGSYFPYMCVSLTIRFTQGMLCRVWGVPEDGSSYVGGICKVSDDGWDNDGVGKGDECGALSPVEVLVAVREHVWVVLVMKSCVRALWSSLRPCCLR